MPCRNWNVAYYNYEKWHKQSIFTYKYKLVSAAPDGHEDYCKFIFFLSPEPDTGHPFWHCDFANIKQAVKHIYGDQWNFFQLISICLTRNSALVIRLWSGVDTTADEKSLSRRTIRTNACAQGKIIEFLSILHYNESLDISTDRALRTLQHR